MTGPGQLVHELVVQNTLRLRGAVQRIDDRTFTTLGADGDAFVADAGISGSRWVDVRLTATMPAYLATKLPRSIAVVPARESKSIAVVPARESKGWSQGRLP